MWLAAACTPSLDWREVRFDNARLTGWMPCKPDRAQRTVDLGGRAAQLTLMGCAAAGMDFTLGQLTVPPGLAPEQALQAWKTASLASLQADPGTAALPWSLARAAASPAPMRVLAQGRQGLSAHWAWFAYDGQLYQAAVYAPSSASMQPAREAADVLFSGFQFP